MLTLTKRKQYWPYEFLTQQTSKWAKLSRIKMGRRRNSPSCTWQQSIKLREADADRIARRKGCVHLLYSIVVPLLCTFILRHRSGKWTDPGGRKSGRTKDPSINWWHGTAYCIRQQYSRDASQAREEHATRQTTLWAIKHIITNLEERKSYKVCSHPQWHHTGSQ